MIIRIPPPCVQLRHVVKVTVIKTLTFKVAIENALMLEHNATAHHCHFLSHMELCSDFVFVFV